MKKLLVKLRTSIKFIVLVSIATLLILGTITLVYKPIYSVYLDGELIGYCADKAKLQRRISDFVENGDEESSNLAYVSVDKMPTYKICLLKRDVTTSDEKIFDKIKTTGTSYYKYYAILDKEEEKAYVETYEEAEEILKKLKEKDSNNIKDVSIVEKYETQLKEFASVDDVVSKLYEKKAVVVAKVTSRYSSTTRSGGTLPTSRGTSSSYVNIGINLIKPVTGTLTSRFGSISSLRRSAHKGLDIATANGTPIKAAAGGTVVYAGWNSNGYGNLVIISHGNGVQTYYGHCSKIYVKVGDTVSQGSKIAAVGSTGNSTGPHLHLEVRVNGVAYNPQHYVY